MSKFEYHVLACHDAFSSDLYFHNMVVLFDTELKVYIHTLDSGIVDLILEDEMRQNNYIEEILSVDAFLYIEEHNSLISDIESYNYIYNNPHQSYFSKGYNKAPISWDSNRFGQPSYLDDLPF